MAFPCWWQPWCALRVFLLVSFRFHAKSPSFLCCFGSCPVADAEPLLEVGSLSACGASVLCLSNRQLLCRMSHDIGWGRQHEQQSTTFEDLLLKQQLQQQKLQQSTKTSNSKQATVTKQQARTLMMAGKDKPQRRQRQTTKKMPTTTMFQQCVEFCRKYSVEISQRTTISHFYSGRQLAVGVSRMAARTWFWISP